MKMARLCRIGLLPFLGMAITACGQKADSGPVVKVSGIVQLNNKPLEGAFVSFVPQGQTKGWGANGFTNENGVYTLTAERLGKEGAPVGTYKVVISKRVMPDGKPVPKDDQTLPAESPAREVLPPKYNDVTVTQLSATVAEGSGSIDFQLKVP